MSATDYEDLSRHVGHSVEVVTYAEVNVAVECEECNEVLMDYDSEEANMAKATLENLSILIDEIKKARERAGEETYDGDYIDGYEDGLSMALSILEGLTE